MKVYESIKGETNIKEEYKTEYKPVLQDIQLVEL